MREIKFRAWDKRFKKMDSGSGALLLRINSTDFSDPMQYTGLKDKNGKEIYEGDLLIFQGDRNAMFEVFYNDTYGRYSCCRTHYLGSRCGGYVPEIEDKKFEVIGNIWENSDLLAHLEEKQK